MFVLASHYDGVPLIIEIGTLKIFTQKKYLVYEE